MIPSSTSLKNISKYHKRINKNMQYSNFGPLENELCNRIAEYIGDDNIHVATCSSATAGMLGLLNLMTDENPAEWLLPAWTFSATISAAKLANIECKFYDVDFGTMSITDKVLKEESNKIAVAPFGSRIDGIVNRHFSGKLIVDAAASFGALRGVTLNDSQNWVCVVSLHSTKNLGAGEGGFIFSKNKDTIEKFRRWTNFGFNSFRESISLGFNAKLSEYNCAVALANLDVWNIQELKLKRLASKELGIHDKFELTSLSVLKEKLATPYWIVIFNSKSQKNKALEIFSSNQIPFREWWGKGCHLMPAYSDIPKYEALLNTQNIAEKYLGLPHHTYLTNKDIALIAKSIHRIII